MPRYHHNDRTEQYVRRRPGEPSRWYSHHDAGGRSHWQEAATRLATKGSYLSTRYHEPHIDDDNTRGRAFKHAAPKSKAITGTVNRIHPTAAGRPQTPPGGHFYIRNGELHPLLDGDSEEEISSSDELYEWFG